MGSIRGFMRITMLFALLAVSLSAMAHERDLPSDRALSAFRNSEDCGFYAVAAEKTRAMENTMRAERARLAATLSGAEAGLKQCAEAAGLDYDGVDENDLSNACGGSYDRWLTVGVQLRLLEDELGKVAAASEEVLSATALRCTLPSVAGR